MGYHGIHFTHTVSCPTVLNPSGCTNTPVLDKINEFKNPINDTIGSRTLEDIVVTFCFKITLQHYLPLNTDYGLCHCNICCLGAVCQLYY